MKHFVVISACLLAAMLCGCKPKHPAPIETKVDAPASSNLAIALAGADTNVVVSFALNEADFNNAASSLISSLLESGAWDKATNQPPVLEFGRFINQTSQAINFDLLTHKISIGLTQSGKAHIKAMGEPILEARRQENTFINGPIANLNPDYVLSGRIIETANRPGETQSVVYSFQLSLADQQGITVWAGEKEVAKQGARAAVGF